MIDFARVREMRDKLRAQLGLEVGQPITNEQISAALAMLAEVWTFRIWCSPERHTGDLKIQELMKEIANGLSAELMAQQSRFLPHAKTFSVFRESQDGRIEP